MIHAILTDLFTPEQARHHVEVIRRHLLAADGARLFDRPLPYRGGIQRHFQRARDRHVLRDARSGSCTRTPTSLCGGDGAPGERPSVLPALRQACPRDLQSVVPKRTAATGQLLHVELRRGVPGSLPGRGAYDEVRTGASR
jgi:hypothetical protein